MKAGIIFTGTGPILILTSYESFEDPKLVAKLEVKGIKKFIASDLPLERVQEKYGNQYKVVMGDLYQTDDLRVRITTDIMFFTVSVSRKWENLSTMRDRHKENGSSPG